MKTHQYQVDDLILMAHKPKKAPLLTFNEFAWTAIICAFGYLFQLAIQIQALPPIVVTLN